MMALDISNHESYLRSHLSSPPNEFQTQNNVSLLPLPDGVWDEEKQELTLGPEKLQLSIVRPVFFADEISCPETNNDGLSIAGCEPKIQSNYKGVTVQEVLLRR